MIEKAYMVFSLGGKELCSYSIEGTFEGELDSTLELLAGSNKCRKEDIKVEIRYRKTAGKEKRHG